MNEPPRFFSIPLEGYAMIAKNFIKIKKTSKNNRIHYVGNGSRKRFEWCFLGVLAVIGLR